PPPLSPSTLVVRPSGRQQDPTQSNTVRPPRRICRRFPKVTFPEDPNERSTVAAWDVLSPSSGDTRQRPTS
ncbi:MAG: hypothetical protein ACRDHK_08085, partial [Actinomycetota bacterium]